MQRQTRGLAQKCDACSQKNDAYAKHNIHKDDKE